MEETKRQPVNLGTLIPVLGLALLAILYQKYGNGDIEGFIHKIYWIVGIAITLLIAFLGIKFWLKNQGQNDPSGLEIGRNIPESTWLPRTRFFLPVQKLRHILVTGLTGSGKSTFIRRFVEQILAKDLRFMYFDFKGEQSDYEELIEICRRAGIEHEIQCFDLSDPAKCFTCNPLMILQDRLETVGFVKSIFFEKDANHYYVNQAEQFLHACLHLMDDAEVPRTFKRIEEIYYNDRTRLTLIARAKAKMRHKNATEPFYINYFNEVFKQLTSKQRSERFSGFLSILTLFNTEPVSRIFNTEDESQLKLSSVFDENRTVIIRVPGEVYGDFSRKVVEAFVKVMPVLIARRRRMKNRKDYWLLLDEGCSYVGQTMVDLAKKAGSAGVKLLVTRMCDSDFESVEPGFLGKMLSAFDTFVCFQTNEPQTRETMAKLAMTYETQKRTFRLQRGEETGDGSIRLVREFRVHPTEFGQLQPGQAYFIAPRIQLFQKVQISQPNMLKEAA